MNMPPLHTVNSTIGFSEPFRSRSGSRAVPMLIAFGALVSGGIICWAVDDAVIAAGFAAGVIGVSATFLVFLRMHSASSSNEPTIDWSIVRSAMEHESTGCAITDRSGRLVCANDQYGLWFRDYPSPLHLPLEKASAAQLEEAARKAWRDESSQLDWLEFQGSRLSVTVSRSGKAQDHLFWRFSRHHTLDLRDEALRLIESKGGDRLGEAGIMVALVGGDGRLHSANRSFILRATGKVDTAVSGMDFISLFEPEGDMLHFRRETQAAHALKLMQVPLEDDAVDSPALLFLVDEEGRGPRGNESAHGLDRHLRTLLSMLPLGLALTDREGRFLYLNDAFARTAGIEVGATPLYPGDLVVREDKAVVADTVRRLGGGQQQLSGDIAIRLLRNPDEPIALTIAAVKGLGEAVVLLSLKDTAEEVKLKRQAEQATKMQAVGQLAGGVAHDFNNILTAIIGHCDLMLMRHAPGDSDYDDIQQIRNNSNRAASLTRQLLAFSRQQTLRPQILQLPDVISEVSNLLKRLLGEMVTLNVSHGRNLGAVRADPGQLEQVIVNLVVNARDAMPDGGCVTIQTYAMRAEDVRALGIKIMPIIDFTALRISDTGTGIPSEILPKIFEPFFTTKEVGKGTGLGLSTVYGIVKQSGGFIFADSPPGEGTSFTIYLPVHHAEPAVVPKEVQKLKSGELWGSGTILLVEDEDMVRAVAERALTRHGYTVLTAENGEDALNVLAGGATIDLLISDVVMPTMDGPTMVRQARKSWPDLPILFMSGYAEEQLRKSIDLDHVAFLPKPFSVKQLAEAARSVLEAK